MDRTTPAIFLFENVLGVSERSKDDAGNILEPAVEAMYGKRIPLNGWMKSYTNF